MCSMLSTSTESNGMSDVAASFIFVPQPAVAFISTQMNSFQILPSETVEISENGLTGFSL